ncbi:MAG: tetratricopeptide repeat protein [Bacteroidia bacterium]|nr:tetratricopeptide repeat protein [Bacteroidia bacterium]
MRLFTVLLIFFLIPLTSFSQKEDEEMAAQFFANKDYSKAADLYEKLVKQNPESIYFYENYLQSLISLKDFKQAEKVVEKRIKKSPYNFSYKVDIGYLYDLQGEEEKKNKLFQGYIDENLSEYSLIDNLANAFLKRRFIDEAIKTYQKGRKSIKRPSAFALETADLYFYKHDLSNAINELLVLVEDNDFFISNAKDRMIVNFNSNEDYSILNKELIARLQKKPEQYAFNDLLMWSFIQQKDWNGAMVQAKAIDKRMKEEGRRVLDLGNICKSNEAFDKALACYSFVISLGKEKSYYYEAQKGMLQTGMEQLRLQDGVSMVKMQELEAAYKRYLSDYKLNWQTGNEQKELAELHIYYMHQAGKGIEELAALVKIPGVESRLLAKSKLMLADAYLISGDTWEADLLYKQVEKDFEEDPLGQEAKYSYSRLCYYRGEFDWAQTQLDVLKGATTQLISNNAIRLSLLIQDNTGLDSTEEAMKIYAQADMFIFQNRYDEALNKLDSISILFPGHTLTDEILFAKALIMEKSGKYTEAENYYNKVIKDYSFDILADNALLNLAKLYEYKLNDLEKAKSLYEKLIIDYPGSLFVNDARRHFRQLRGDNTPEKELPGYWD